MRTVYIRELSFHTPSSLRRLLHVESDKVMHCIRLLCARGILKLCTNNDKKEYDTPYSGGVRGNYQFIYVGLILMNDICIIVYPKYLPEISADSPEDELHRTMRQIFRVLRKSGGSYSNIAGIEKEGAKTNDRLALMLMLLEKHDEYGVYSNYMKTYADNGSGDISWERTIATCSPFASNGRPIYAEYKTVETDQDAADFVMRLHRAVLTECSSFMQESGLASLLGLDEVWLTDTTVDDFGDSDYVVYRLEQERGVQFVTWKQEVIDLLIRYVNENGSFTREEFPLCLGTSCFYHVWEEACKVAFDDALNKRLYDLGVELLEPFAQMGNVRLIDIIPKPKWSVPTDDGEQSCGDVATLRPDTVLLHHDGAGDNLFAILDAKYYTPSLGSDVAGVPGVESVTKQFLYQSAFRLFVSLHGYTRVVNAFLVPSAKQDIEHIGRVRFPDVIPLEVEPLSNVIEMYALPAQMVFEAYLTNTMLDTNELLKILN